MTNYFGKVLFYVFLVVGIVSFIFMSFSLFNPDLLCELNIDDKSYSFLPAVFILLSSLIAAFSVNRTVINTREMKENEVLKERNRNEKVLKIGKDFLLGELKVQDDFFNNLYNEILDTELDLKNLETIKYFYTDSTNENKIINQLDYLLKIELHNYTKEDVLSVLFETKGDVIIIIHYVNVLKNIHIPNNDKEQSLEIIDEIFKVISSIRKNLTENNI